MNKTLTTCFIMLCSPSVFAAVGSGFYFSAGAGAGWENANQLETFNIDYNTLYANIHVDDELNDAVRKNFNDSAVYNDNTESVLAGRAAIGYLWDIFDGEPTKIGGAIYTVNATLGLELGYRYFDQAETNEVTVIEEGSNFDTFETVNQKYENQAIDLSAVLRLPFTEDSKFALLLKGGVAYNFYEVKTTINIEADTTPPPTTEPPYNRTVHDNDRHNEFLPVFAGALEYMFFDNFGMSVEYNAIVGSSHDADSQMLLGNIIFRL